ncbi:PREDICTED: DNA-directed RNA polymerase III subunit RPC7 [Nanorana parkeri]|uniref:DNA-directed RNA polymerase III subunit RPC7 n=1 Tax=Nanorana parkeri TaxID=125878 RepID=UPI00085495E2|nr:PREDICTED: DNA-directed RNA polymerase III subunit RPC7 [Nanorana parkeri]
MAGRGRGRGASFTFDLQAIGFSRGEALPETQAQPLPLFPNIDYKAASLLEGEEQDYLLALKRELRGNMKRLPYYIRKGVEKQSIEKYITKYEVEAERKLHEDWVPDWRTLPKEMKAVKRKPKKRNNSVKKAEVKKADANVDVLKKIEELEKKGDGEKSDEEGEKKKGSGEEEDEEAEVEIEEEEEIEEENDYIASYFEDGDDFGNSDENMDEATY